ncbi:lipoprotein [Amycolatopsis sp. NBRC 101858]|uniref:SCO0930 family lipoprotein n=1 Tax=Amycolatopsis sp. NBRC 101858 TaxID=3032200 RepID=UPI0024A04FDA|nr:SCO0930 family lipoprotein [Amycolatopsis sp. NBRC 101858]GLY42329.1 lipoprotein [Amycolatopsis sp. NBRC 101858]
MNRARPGAAALSAVAGVALVAACGTNPYATTGRQVSLGAQQLSASTVQASPGAGQAQLVTSTVEGLGAVLTDAEGHTLYRYAKDTAKPPKAACVDACAETWPPLVSDSPALAAGVDAQLVGLVTRPDGRKQVTVGGWPVYRYAKDTGSGIALGQNVSADWAAITPEGQKAAAAPSASAEPTTLGTTDIGGLGPVLTDQAGRTLYLFTRDGRGSGKSTCDGVCARTWPPLLVTGRSTVAEDIDTGLVGQITRADGSKQVTVGGWPVYTYAKDGAPGEATGHGVGDTWYAMEPNGCRVDPERRPAVATVSTGGY